MLSTFGTLDERIQILYQGSNRFVVISGVSYSEWTIHIGLSGAEGRWWRGTVTKADIKTFLVSFCPTDTLDGRDSFRRYRAQVQTRCFCLLRPSLQIFLLRVIYT